MCLNKPIQIPVGSNGKSVFIAYAQSSTGTGFSYTPADSRTYISFVTKKGAVSQSDFTTWTKFIGTNGIDGINGINGTGVSNVYVSDGSTAIGGTVYTVNSVIVLLTSGTYINAGQIQLTPVWNTITPINSWTAGTGINAPRYSILNGFIYFRGAVSYSGASNTTFATLGAIGMTETISTSVSTNSVSTDIASAILTIDALGNLSAFNISGIPEGTGLLLDSIGPISIR